MRVVSGWLGGRTFDSPGTASTHPMSEKIRAAIFNILGDINGLTVVDSFTGSGSLVIEAISRGAKNAVALDSDKRAIKVVTKNIETLGIEDRVRIIQANSYSWSVNNAGTQYDIVFCDPPYDDIRRDALNKIVPLTKVGGIIMYSLPPDVKLLIDTRKFSLLSEKRYGNATLAFYRRIA